MISGYREILIRTALTFLFTVLMAGCAGRMPTDQPAGEPEEAGEVEDEAPASSAGAIIFDATLAAGNGEYGKAKDLLIPLVESEPENIDALRLLAKVHAAAGEKAASSMIWKKIAALDPSDPDASYEEGNSLAVDEKWSELRSLMVQTLSFGKADERHYLLAGQASMELGYKDEAETYLEKAGNLEQATALLGKLYYTRGKTGKAERAFLRTLEKNSSNFTANLYLGYIHYNSGENSKALESYAAAHLIDPGDPLACLSLASLHEKIGNRKSAAKYYEKALTLDGTPAPEKRKVYISLAKIYIKSPRKNDIYSLVSRGLREFPSAGGLNYYRGEALLRDGRKGEAKEQFKAASKDPAWKKQALARFHSIR